MSMVSKPNRIGRYFLPLFSLSVYLFLYIPIIVLVVFSLNKSSVPFMWEGVSLHWYRELFKSPEIWHALVNSLIVASSAVILSISLAVLFVVYSRSSKLSRWYLTFYTNSATPEIVLAVGLLSIFSFFSIPLGVTTLVAGHTLIGLGFVVPIIRGRFIELDKKFTEASLDLGATPEQTIKRVIIPLMYPAIIGSALIVFALSLDDFIISFFCSGGTTQTLPIYIFIMIRSGATPLVNALSTLLLVVSSGIVIIFASLKIKKLDFLR